MKGAPPSGSPPGSPPEAPLTSPFPGNPRTQAHEARRQARVQRKQGRAQSRQESFTRKQARFVQIQQKRSLRRTSLLAPVLLVALGTVALLVRTGHPAVSVFLSWYSHWWPLLFLFSGMFLLVEWAADLFLHTGASSASPRRLGPAAFLLLLAGALFGSSTHGLRQAQTLFGSDVHLGLGDFEELLAQKHESTKSLDTPFPAGTRLLVSNPHGNITLVGASDDGQLHLVLNKQVFTDSDTDATQLAQQLDPQVSLAGGILQVTIPTLVGASADLTLTLPESAPVSVNAQHGSVDISALRAPVNITADHGDITCKAIAGPITAQINRNGSSFTAHDITGDVTVHGHAQDLNLTDVRGQVTLEGEFFGNTHLERLRGPVAFRTHRTQLNLGQLVGELDISPESELTGSQIIGPTLLHTSSRNVSFARMEIIGPTLLHTSSRNVSFARMAGDISVTNSKGSVDITSSAPLGNIDVQNRDGAVTLTIPEHAGLTLDAQTRGGHIDTDLGLDPNSQNGSETLQGTVHGGGPRVTLRTSHLDVDIHQANIQTPTQP